ncbi:glycosyltransferase [Leifsonia kafniensis]|uniref:Glycosyltransferase n=1 Tax=Leifsonia kafniensis TaxID=475957 RepID=A0ABP7KTQ5_9MICO
MRVLSVVTLISPNGEYGGPVRVALNQAAALRSDGHDVVVAGGARGFGRQLPREADGVPLKLFAAKTIVPGTGFAGLATPGLQRWIKQAASGFDVVHVHAARDLITLPLAGWLQQAGIPYVLQTHGMIDRSSHPLARPLDAMLTRRVLAGARTVFYLTARERQDLIDVGGAQLRLRELVNGVPASDRLASTDRGDATEVLFLARLAPRKRPLAFVEMAQRLSASFPDVTFTLVGPNEGEGAAVTHRIGTGTGSGTTRPQIAWEGPIAPELTRERMSRASIYVLPSVNEPFPMSVLEAMSLGLPVVITDTCGLAPAVQETGSGLVVDDTVDALTDAVSSLLRDPSRAHSMGEAGEALSRDRFGMPAIAAALTDAYRS